MTRKILGLIAAVLATLWIAAGPAAAESADQIDNLKIDYRLDRAGILHVRETFVWRFASISHGIQRELITREPDPDTGKDIVYKISNFRVTSPDPRVATDVQASDEGGPLDRNRSTVYRIGDPDQYVFTPTATYVISYDETGAVRSSGSYDELYWDATGSGNPATRRVTITAAVPGGAQDVRCYAGPVGSATPCTTATKGTTQAHFAASNLAAGNNVTIGVKIKPGLITDNHPHLVERASFGNVLTTPSSIVTGALALLVTAGIVIGGVIRSSRRNADSRFVDLPPGTHPEPGSHARIGRSDPGLEIPVRFEPPDVPIAEAAFLADRRYSTRITAAVLVSLAVSGAIRIIAADEKRTDDKKSGGNSGLAVELLDEHASSTPEERSILRKLFADPAYGPDRLVISRPGSLAGVHQKAEEVTIRKVRDHRWFDLLPGSAKHGGSVVDVLALVGFCVLGGLALLFGVMFAALWATGQLGTGFPFPVLFLFPPLLALAITALLSMRRGRKGRRSAEGRATCDQVEGFRQYLATAEADQLKFEEGEDIFSRYLPWAIAFDLVDRWQRICQQLVETGRLPEQSPSWLSGFSNGYSAFDFGVLTGSLTTAATPLRSSGGFSSSGSSSGGSFSSSGFGSSGSSFGGGGGFSGGGGGGGGSSSW